MMRALCKVSLAGALIALVVVPVLSQGQGRGGRGFGGGMNSPMMMLANESVQKELKLTPEQLEKVKEASKTIQDKHREEMAAARELEREEAREKMMEIQKAQDAEFAKEISSVLTADQSKRLGQIKMQVQGVGAFSTEEVGKNLKLTDEQKDKIKTINEDLGQEMRPSFRAAGPRAISKRT